MFESLRGYGRSFKGGVIIGFGLGGRDIADRLEQAPVIEPVDPVEGCELHLHDAFPGIPAMNELGFVEAIHGFREGVIIGIADAADGRFDAGIEQALGIADAHILRSAVRVMNQAAFFDRLPRVQGLFEGVKHEIGPGVTRDAPADNAAGEGVNDEGDIGEPLPG